MATTRKTAQQKPLEQQIECAKARAKTAKIDLVSIYADGNGQVTWTITSACNPNDWYHVSYGADNHLTCDCPATVVCKHIGLVLNRNIDYTRKNRSAPTPAAPAATKARCWECGDAFTPATARDHYCDWCASIMPALRTNACQPLSDEGADDLLHERATETAIEAAADDNADYDAWLDSLPEDEAAYARWLEQETVKLEQAASKRRETALPYDTGLGLSIFKSEDHDGEYIPRDYYQHAYR